MNDNKIKIDESELALCRSAFYEALSLGFRSPTNETRERLIDDNQNQALAEIAAILDENGGVEKPRILTQLVRKLKECLDVEKLEALEHSYQFYFGHTAQAKVPPYETGYGEETLFQQPQQLGDISGFYNAFGLQLNSKEHERADHISCECEFLSFLTRKEAYALNHNDITMLAETRKAQKLFLKDHLGRFAPSFSKLLIRKDPVGFYGVFGKLCNEFISMECDRHGVTAGSEQLRLRSSVIPDECIACGSGEEIIREINDSNYNPEQ